MVTILITIFIIGYLLIAFEHELQINKTVFALLMCGVLWAVMAFFNGDMGEALLMKLGDTCEVLVFLIGAMTIVELIDRYEGFQFITDHITAHNERRLLWILVLISFFMSAVLDNMTTTIIMIMLTRKLISEQKDRWLFASVIAIAANSGGAWSPIGDVTTIMLWMKDDVTTGRLILNLFIPSLLSTVIPAFIACRFLKKGDVKTVQTDADSTSGEGSFSRNHKRISIFVLFAGVAGLLFVPVFKTLTNLPPFMGMIVSLGVLWLITEVISRRLHMPDSFQGRVSQAVHNIDMSTILFFLGILMAVGALGEAGILTGAAKYLDANVHEPFIIASSIGVLSAIVDNVPLVAACINMYPTVDPATLSTLADPEYMRYFVSDGLFWHLLTFSVGVGGSLLIIGSAAGVVAMGLEKIPFMWYMKRISLMALAGYITGILVIWAESFVPFMM
jgi:Na+/H+ antiporter NhaD/arsenite permease-like protein